MQQIIKHSEAIASTTLALQTYLINFNNESRCPAYVFTESF